MSDQSVSKFITENVTTILWSVSFPLTKPAILTYENEGNVLCTIYILFTIYYLVVWKIWLYENEGMQYRVGRKHGATWRYVSAKYNPLTIVRI